MGMFLGFCIVWKQWLTSKYIVVSIIFLVGSIISALAQSMAMLLAGRTIQGLGAGGIMGLVNITVSDIVTVRERGKYLGLCYILKHWSSQSIADRFLAMVGFTWAIARYSLMKCPARSKVLMHHSALGPVIGGIFTVRMTHKSLLDTIKLISCSRK